MTVKEFLSQYQEANHQIDAKLEQVHHLRALSTRTTQAFSPDRVDGSAPSDRLSKIISKIVDMEHEVDADIDRLQETKHQVEAAIAGVSPAALRDVLTLKYINGLRWEDIALKLHYTFRHTTRLHRSALKEIETGMSLYVPLDR